MEIRSNEKGNVTLIALILLVVLTLIGISANRTSTLDMQIAGNEIFFKQDFYIAEGGVNIEATEIGKGEYPVLDVNNKNLLLANNSDKPPDDGLENHKVLGESYDFAVHYRGYYAPPSGYSIIHFNRYDYNVATEGGDSKVKVASRFYKIGPKAEQMLNYEKIDNEVVFGIFKNKLGDFDLFGEYIVNYLKTQD